MRTVLLLALVLHGLSGEALAQLTSPVGRAADAIDVEEAVAFPSEIVAAQIRAALADPRNQAPLDTLESVLAGTEGEAPMATPLAVAIQSPPAIPPASATSSTAAEEPTTGAASGLNAWLQARLSESRTAVLRATTAARTGIAASGIPDAAYLISAILGALLLVGAALWRLRSASEERSLKQARKLARRGIGVAEVARRTGLSRELIQMIEARRNRKDVA